MFPDQTILFGFLIPIKSKYFVMIIGGTCGPRCRELAGHVDRVADHELRPGDAVDLGGR